MFYGGAGNDSLDGQSGNDTVNGNGGDDTVIGGTGSDSLNGNAGNDLVFDSDFVLQVLPTLSVGNVTVTEGNSATTTATFTITLSQASTLPVTVSYLTVNGTADAADFAAIAATPVTFAPSEVTKTVTVAVNGDAIAELDEFFFLALSSPVNALLGNPTGTATITNDDGTGIRLLGAAFNGRIYDVDINTAAVTLVGNSGVSGLQDFTVGTGNVLYTTVQFPSVSLGTVNRTTAAVTLIGPLNPQPVTTIEGALGFDVTQNAIFASFTGDDPRLYRIDPATAANTDLGPLLFNGTPVLGNYNVDAMAFRGNELFMILPSGPSAILRSSLLRIDTTTREITVVGSLGVALVNGAAGLAYDQTTDTFLLVNGSGNVSSNLFRVNATTGVATLIGNTGINDMSGLTLDIAQLAPQVGASISDASVVEGTGGTNSLNFTVTLDRNPTASVVVNFTTTNGAATAGSDYTATTSSLTFAPGQTSLPISIPINPDSLGEGNESFFVRLTSVTGGAILDGIGIGTIVDDDIDSASNTMNGGTGNDTIRGGIGDDIINGDEDNDVIDGRDGNDTISGGSGHDSITGGNGDDTVNGSAGNDTLDGGSGDDTYVWDGTNPGTDLLADTQGYQRLIINGGSTAETFVVSNSNSRVKVTRGTSSITTNTTVSEVAINAGAGNDIVNIQALRGVRPVILTVNGDAGNDLINATGVNLGGVLFTANGGTGNDVLNGSLSNEKLNGDDDNDVITGNAGNDVLSGGSGLDTLNGSAGNDSLNGGDSNDSLLGGAGNDVLNGDGGADFLNGEDGDDVASGGEGNDNLIGGAGNDLARGDNGDDALVGGAGNDSLDGGVGDDRVRGSTGDDLIKGGDGNDALFGEEGIDTIDGGDGDDFVDASFGFDLAPGGVGNIVFGGDGNDTILGGADNDTLVGGDGHDAITAGAGSDFLYGGDGDDSLNGNGGTDAFNSGAGTDSLDVNAAAGEIDNLQLGFAAAVIQAMALLNGF